MDSDGLSKSAFFTLEGETLPVEEQPRAVTFKNLGNVIVDKKFRVQALLGAGGMGEVYLARHLMLDKDVALKIFGPGNTSTEGVLRFQREAQSIAKLNHKNIVHVYDFGISEEGIPYYTMEHLMGESLAETLTRYGALEPTKALELFIQICNGLSIAHSKGIIHRDLKPGNIFIETDKSSQIPNSTVKIVDFGIASLLDQSISKQKLTTTNTIFGSPLYLSPEQATGRSLSESSDIYSLGCTLFETLTGRPPFRGATARETIMMHLVQDPPKLSDVATEKTFPAALEKVVASMLAKSPEERQPNIGDVRTELAAVLDGLKRRELSLNSDLTESKPQKRATSHHFLVTNGGAQDAKPLDKFKNIVGLIAVLTLVSTVGYAVVKAITAESVLKTELLSKVPSKTPYGAGSNSKPSSNKTNKKFLAVERELPYTKGVFSSRIIQHNEQPCVVFQFPVGVDMGQFSVGANLDLMPERIQRVAANIAYPLVKPSSMAFFPSEQFMKDENSFAIIPTDFLQALKEVRVQRKNATRTIELIARQKELVSLDLAKSQIADGELAGISKLTKLTSLRVDDTGITGLGLANLPGIERLQSLSMSGCNNVGPALKKLKNSKTLTSLSLDDTAITEDDARAIGTMSNLRVLNLRGAGLTVEGLKHLIGLKHLTELDLRDCPVNKPAGVQMLKQLGKQGLQLLNLNWEGWSDSDKIQIGSYIRGANFKTERTHRTKVPLDSVDLQMLLEKSE